MPLRRVNIAAPEFLFDLEDPEGFRAGRLKVGDVLGGERLGASVYDVPPGQSVCPFHYELGEEEWLLVLTGRALVRTPAGENELGPMDMTRFEIGPAGAHQISNPTDEELRVLIFSDVTFPTVSVYPDSDKIGVSTKGGADDVIVRRSSSVDYYEGEG